MFVSMCTIQTKYIDGRMCHADQRLQQTIQYHVAVGLKVNTNRLNTAHLVSQALVC